MNALAILRKIGVGVLRCAAVLALLLYLLQDKLMFHPDGEYFSPASVGMPEFAEETLAAGDGTPLRLWLAPGRPGKPAILFFHGNAGQNAAFAPGLRPFLEAGYPVAMLEYRGFAGAAGKLREEAVFGDAATAYDFLQSRGHARIVLMGFSFGTGVACGILPRREPVGVVLVSPFFSFVQKGMETATSAAYLLMRDHYRSDRHIAHLRAPLLVVYGADDTLLPPKTHAEKLFALAPGRDKTRICLDHCGHNRALDRPDAVKAVLRWLDGR